MKSSLILLLTLIILSGFALTTPITTFAQTNNNSHNTNKEDKKDNKDNNKDSKNNNDCKNHGERKECKKNDDKNCNDHKDDKKCKKEDENNCKKNPEKKECHHEVPEFGDITGGIALLTSSGTFFYIKKKNS